MGAITVRKLTDEEIRDLRISAAKRGVSMEQEARDRLRRPLADDQGHPRADDDATKWRLKATRERLLALGVRPDVPIDQKSEADALYRYLEEE